MMDILDMGKIRGIELVATLVRDKDQTQGNNIEDGKEETDLKNIYKAELTKFGQPE